MSGPLWTSIGFSLGAAILNAVLGLTRPLSKTYLSFAWIMAFVAAYLYLERALYAGTTPAESIEIERLEGIVAHGLIAGILVFIPAYTRVHLPRWLWSTVWVLLGVFFFINITSTHSIWYAAPPHVFVRTQFGEPYYAVVAAPSGPLQYAHVTYAISIGLISIGCGVKMYLRGDRRRGSAMAISLAAAVIAELVDVVRDEIGASWPYLAEFGLVAWGIVMTVQLALDYREVEDGLLVALERLEEQRAELTRAIDLTLRVRDRLNTPLQTLELGLAIQPTDRPEVHSIVDELHGAVRKLTALGREVESTAAQRPAEAHG